MRNTVLMHRSHTPASGGAQTANEPAPGSKNETITAARDARAAAEGTLSAELTALRALSPMLAPSTKPLVDDVSSALTVPTVPATASLAELRVSFLLPGAGS